jgi:hypothetical protein
MTFQTQTPPLAIGGEFDRDANGNQIIFWHSELPPFDAEAMGEHVVEADSGRVLGTIAHRDDLWSLCCEELMAQVRLRLNQEILRLGGNYAHVLSESIDSKHDDVSGEAWLHGRFTYMLYRQPQPS